MNLQQRRLEQGATQADMAYIVGVHPTYISKIEHNALKVPPSDELIECLAIGYDVPESDLIAYFGKIDFAALREIARQSPVVARVLRRIQSGAITEDQWDRIMDIIGESNDNTTD